jgi:hypothetical protein
MPDGHGQYMDTCYAFIYTRSSAAFNLGSLVHSERAPVDSADSQILAFSLTVELNFDR